MSWAPLALAAAAASSGVSVTLIVSVLGALGVGAIVAAVVTGLFSKKKLSAEATSLITNAASTVTQMMEKRLAESVALVDHQKEIMAHMAEAHHAELTKMGEAHAAERDDMRRVLQLHVAWDAIAIAKLGELGIDLPPTPPVTLAVRRTDDNGFPLSLS